MLYSLFRNEKSNSIQIDYEKTFYYHREVIKQIDDEEEKRTKRTESIKNVSKFGLKCTFLFAAGYVLFKKFKYNFVFQKLF